MDMRARGTQAQHIRNTEGHACKGHTSSVHKEHKKTHVLGTHK